MCKEIKIFPKYLEKPYDEYLTTDSNGETKVVIVDREAAEKRRKQLEEEERNEKERNSNLRP